MKVPRLPTMPVVAIAEKEKWLFRRRFGISSVEWNEVTVQHEEVRLGILHPGENQKFLVNLTGLI